MILADLRISQPNHLEQKEYHLWTPLHQNMDHNNWKLLATRRTIETRFSKLCALFEIEQTFARVITGLQLRIEQIILVYNLRYLEFY